MSKTYTMSMRGAPRAPGGISVSVVSNFQCEANYYYYYWWTFATMRTFNFTDICLKEIQISYNYIVISDIGIKIDMVNN